MNCKNEPRAAGAWALSCVAGRLLARKKKAVSDLCEDHSAYDVKCNKNAEDEDNSAADDDGNHVIENVNKQTRIRVRARERERRSSGNGASRSFSMTWLPSSSVAELSSS